MLQIKQCLSVIKPAHHWEHCLTHVSWETATHCKWFQFFKDAQGNKGIFSISAHGNIVDFVMHLCISETVILEANFNHRHFRKSCISAYNSYILQTYKEKKADFNKHNNPRGKYQEEIAPSHSQRQVERLPCPSRSLPSSWSYDKKSRWKERLRIH